jgi:hypothetical protein
LLLNQDKIYREDDSMRFEERELKPYAEPVSPSDLKEGVIYFAVNFIDDEMLIPVVEPKVFIGKDLDPQEPGCYFQDLDSHRQGIRFGSSVEATQAIFEIGTEKHVFEYERALDVLMQCALRRRTAN